MHRILITLTLLLFALPALAIVESDKEPLVFESAAQEERYNDLILELRCLVCQNQNLADSDAPLAQDLRRELFAMMQAGRSDDEIKRFMVERYGDFVLYRPPMQGNTLALWVLPMVVLLIGAIGIFFTVRNRNRKLAEQQGAQQQRVEQNREGTR